MGYDERKKYAWIFDDNGYSRIGYRAASLMMTLLMLIGYATILCLFPRPNLVFIGIMAGLTSLFGGFIMRQTKYGRYQAGDYSEGQKHYVELFETAVYVHLFLLVVAFVVCCLHAHKWWWLLALPGVVVLYYVTPSMHFHVVRPVLIFFFGTARYWYLDGNMFRFAASRRELRDRTHNILNPVILSVPLGCLVRWASLQNAKGWKLSRRLLGYRGAYLEDRNGVRWPLWFGANWQISPKRQLEHWSVSVHGYAGTDMLHLAERLLTHPTTGEFLKQLAEAQKAADAKAERKADELARAEERHADEKKRYGRVIRAWADDLAESIAYLRIAPRNKLVAAARSELDRLLSLMLEDAEARDAAKMRALERVEARLAAAK